MLMGMLINIGNIGRDTFDVCQWLLGRIAGGLGVATVVANTVFAAITGVSIASAVVFTKVSVPPMVEHGYTAKFSVGIVAGSSVLGMLIPPSLLLIVFGVLAEVSVGQLFTAAVAPGILLSVAFCGAIVFISNFMPEFAGRLKMPDASGDPLAWTRKPAHSETIWSAIAKMTPIVILIVAVLGGIYSGYFTPTEAGAVGAFLSLVIVCIKAAFTPGMLSWPKFWKVLIDTPVIAAKTVLATAVGADCRRPGRCDSGRQHRFCGDYRRVDCLGRGLHQSVRATNGGAWLYSQVFRWDCGGKFRSRHADPAQPSADRVWRTR